MLSSNYILLLFITLVNLNYTVQTLLQSHNRYDDKYQILPKPSPGKGSYAFQPIQKELEGGEYNISFYL